MSVNQLVASFTARSAQVPSGEQSRVERITVTGGDRYAVQYQAASAQEAIFTLPAVPNSYQGGNLTIVCECSATSTSGTVILNTYIESLAPGGTTDLDTTQSFGSANTVTTSSLPSTAGALFNVTFSTSTATTAGNLLRLKVQRSSGDTSTGDLQLFGVTIYEAVSVLDLSGYTSIKLGSASDPLTFPSTNGSSGNTLLNDGAGNLSWAALAGSGVSSVALSMPGDYSVANSPVTSSGTLTVTRTTQSANTVLAGPITGSPATPTYRALIAQDIPNLPASQITTGQLAPNVGGTGVDCSTATNGQLLIGTGSGLQLATLTAGTGISITNSSGGITIAGSGSVTMPSQFNVSGNTITWNTQSANTVLAGPTSGSAADPTFRALTPTDLPSLGASGVSHSAGICPDPGSSTGNTRFLREDATWQAPPSASLTIGTTAISSGTSGNILYDNASTVGEYTPSQAINAILPSQTGNSGRFLTTNATTASWGTPTASLTVGSTTVSSGTNSYILYNNSGTLGNVQYVPAANGGTGNGAPTAGQIPIGNGSSSYTLGTISSGLGVTVTSSSGSITVARPTLSTVTYGSTTTFNLNNSDTFAVTLTGNPTLAVSNDANGSKFTIILIQDATGSRTVTWWSTISWSTGGVPTLSTAANAVDVFTFIRYSSGNYLGFVAGQGMTV